MSWIKEVKNWGSTVSGRTRSPRGLDSDSASATPVLGRPLNS